ncbi:TIR domain-containing adapter molecule 1 [Acanthochromis polyacanthus]|uniref:TIR domain-containing adapter molecule 1-like n=1 Tax=Acanthochromis polyacanthus TaxID=80966 RepID=A0A3Q1GWN3_9TELE|nr:TIR domain-containing adapter molecule 1 [Acanthochromis polyacanthus]XP_051809674.1 TIR domain-containing adapter molecule 1 [Acanthochromis polyacanthus]
MSHEGQESQGTGLGDVFDILLKAPSERLLSLTLQLGESPEDGIIQALCLIVLQRKAQALNKLQMLGDNSLANHLAEKWQTSGGKLQDFAVHCGHFQALTGDSLAALARIFKVLSEQRLCDPLLRNLAYKRAISTDCQSTSNCEDLQYDQFREEAKAVCGPQVAEWISSSTEVKSESYTDPDRSLNEGNTTLKVAMSQDPSANTHCLPSPLQACPSMSSYPTHLEISIPPTISFQGDKIAPATSGNAIQNTPTLLLSESGTNIAPGQSLSSEPRSKSIKSLLGAKKDSRMSETLAAVSSKSDSQSATPSQTNKPSTEPKFALPSATNIFLPKTPFPKEIHESSKVPEEEEEEVFYAFVILHAPEDVEVAECMREKLEKVTSSEGATFSEDFAIPGKSTLKCVEDAINNSAFTFLLLTRNFNTRMLEMKTNSALINSINKKHKYNTVIPLLPRENCMPRQCIPLPLQTIVPLEENKSFERKIQKSLTPAKIEKQRRIWTAEQRLKTQMERQEKDNLTILMEQQLLLGPGGTTEQAGGDGKAWWLQQPSIHIENANYIMIGNDSQMTVDLGGNSDKDDSMYTGKEQ